MTLGVGPALGPLRRYRSLLPAPGEWEAFCAAVRRSLPTTVWANPLRTTPEVVARRLTAAGLEPQPIAWCPGAFRLRAGTSPGNLVEFVTGLYHIQEEVSLLPVELLAPRPGERVLDLCAAPGGKTARMAVAMGNRGTVVANDRDVRRLFAVRKTLDRLGAANVVTTCWDAANYPRAAGAFDRVLADVPCTCEGTSRKSPEVLGRPPAVGSRRMAGIQLSILRAAVRLARPGGRIVYSTCTYAPEENEAVVDAALAEAAGSLRVVPAAVAGLSSAPGLGRWQGASFHPSLEGALRIWPQANDTGGFFVAVLEKLGPGEGAVPPAAVLPAVPEAERRLAIPLARFGIPAEVLAELRPLSGPGPTLFAAPPELAPPVSPEPLTAGLPLAHADMAVPKLTTAGALLLGGRATRNVVDLAAGRVAAFLGRTRLVVERAELPLPVEPGPVLVRSGELVLGTGFLRRRGSELHLESFFPKAWAPGGAGGPHQRW